MVIKSYSKINLSLCVNSKLKNGLHNIQSFFCLISLCDKIRVKKIKANRDIVIFKGPFAKEVEKSNNSLSRLLKLLRKLEVISNHYSVEVTKNIPVFGGLGGGTSNAAFLLKFILKKNNNKKVVNKVVSEIGSDMRLFFSKQGFLKNLDNVVNIRNKKKFYFLLIQPKFKCRTKEIYSKVKKYTKKQTFNSKHIKNKKNFIHYLQKSNNDLQLIVENKYPVVKKLLLNIKNQKGCKMSRMTGSGSVCYGLFNEYLATKKALKNIRSMYPKFWSSFAKTV